VARHVKAAYGLAVRNIQPFPDQGSGACGIHSLLLCECDSKRRSGGKKGFYNWFCKQRKIEPSKTSKDARLHTRTAILQRLHRSSNQQVRRVVGTLCVPLFGCLLLTVFS
jgi:hypothetical protein